MGRFYTLNSTYNNPAYQKIMQNATNRDMYNSIKTLYDNLFRNLGTQQASYYLPNIASSKKVKRIYK